MQEVKKLIKIILWNMNFVLDSKNANIGDKVLLTAIITSIKQSKINTDINIFTSDPEVIDQEYHVVGIKYSILNLYQIIKTIWESNIFVFAGGEAINDRGSSLYTPFMMHSALLAKLFKKQIVGYGIGIGEKDEISLIGNLLAKYIFNGALVSVRDNKSKEILLSISKPKIVVSSADPAINLKPASDEDVMRILSYAGFNIKNRPLIAIVPRQPLMPLNNLFDRIMNIIPIKIREKINILPKGYYENLFHFKNNIAYICDYLVSKYNAQIIFIPMFKGFMSYRDDLLCSNIITEMSYKDNVKILDNNYSSSDIKGIFGKMDLVIGIPLHSIILATSMLIPVIAFSYESKVDRFMKMLDLDRYSFDIKELESDRNITNITDMIDYIFNNLEYIKNNICNNIDILKNRELNNFDLLNNIFDKMSC